MKQNNEYYKNSNGDVFPLSPLDIQNGRNKDLIKMTQAEIEAFINPPKEIEKVTVITLRQARLHLLSLDLLDDLENIINQNRAYQIEWEYANQIERESPLVKILGQALELDDVAIDNMFIEASKI
ncbi:hypothetical protein [Aliarcobacter butzleri]|uniref:hypothetical protein n=1 Tax=Aliarcobacter butzleri TaxID=28197 RepID=UPI002B2565E1|nr:hypothetical protein [Aliarcobacter butzleri]